MADVMTRIKQAIARRLGKDLSPLPLVHPSISSGWADVNALTGIGGYPANRLTHIHGPAYQTLELTRDWGSTVRLTTLDALVKFRVTRQPERLVVDATALQGPETWRKYDRLQIVGQLPSTVVWVTAGPSKALPKWLKFSASLRLECKDDQLCIIKSTVSATQGYYLPLTRLGLDSTQMPPS